MEPGIYGDGELLWSPLREQGSVPARSHVRRIALWLGK